MNERYLNFLLTLRKSQQMQLEETDRQIEYIQKSVPSGVRKRRNLKKDRVIEKQNYLIKKGIFDSQNEITDKTFKS